MPSRDRRLMAAGVQERALRDDYSFAARVFARRVLAHYAVVRLLVAPQLQPHLIAAYAFLARTDDLADQGPLEQRLPRWRAWSEQVGAGLESGRAEDPVLRAFLHTVSVRQLPHHWVLAYLKATDEELHFTGHATEADFQHYVDTLALPALMLVEDLQHEGGGDEVFRSRCRSFAEGLQRLDFLTDLTEDLGEGRLYLPQEHLDRFGVTRATLEQGEDTAAVRELVAYTCRRTRQALTDSQALLDCTAPSFRPLQRALLELAEHQLSRVERTGSAVTRRTVGYGVRKPLAVLLRERRRSTA
ncbi:squalene/phytoene synthase family protein [Streptomyces sp. S.PB5]|uniref:squalene/phytoene synthase family protein n=1 Tax=Streptomyces sp. S.PB5 TaxID=3020844 RepID=UPI0025B0B8E7|nr:squalene/phytoene synthase family protein [Streptomyces sp. S.PB5]MDN3025921.1 squalene/phytoene synthase family protein [Streptomyces sp. S.PB5]